MKILITGANGQLGQDFQKLLKNEDIEFVPTDYGTNLEELDITDFVLLKKYIQKGNYDKIINCAAYNAVDQAETDYNKAVLINGKGVKNLASLCEEFGIELIHYSTDFVFDGERTSPYSTNETPNPISKYGKSKLQGEKYVTSLSTKFFLIRTSWVFGLGNVNFVKKILEWSKNSSELRVVTDQISAPTYTADLANATLELIKSKQYGLYNITNSGFCSRFEWAEHILNKIEWQGVLKEAKSSDFKTPAKRPKYSVLDNSKFEETIGKKLPHWRDATDRFLLELNF